MREDWNNAQFFNMYPVPLSHNATFNVYDFLKDKNMVGAVPGETAEQRKQREALNWACGPNYTTREFGI